MNENRKQIDNNTELGLSMLLFINLIEITHYYYCTSCMLTITSRHSHWVSSSSLRCADRKISPKLLQPVAANPNREHINGVIITHNDQRNCQPHYLSVPAPMRTCTILTHMRTTVQPGVVRRNLLTSSAPRLISPKTDQERR